MDGDFGATEAKADIKLPALILLVNICECMWCLMDSLNKDAITHQGASVLDSACLRSVMLVIVSLIMMKYFNKSAHDIPKHLRAPVFYRSAGLATTIGLIGSALLVLPVTILNVIINCTPFFTAILAHFFLSDKLTKCEIVAMILSFSGVVLIAYATPDSESTGASAKQANALQNLENPIF
jgi:drug/metabolite transporter (DMT)-like permease